MWGYVGDGGRSVERVLKGYQAKCCRLLRMFATNRSGSSAGSCIFWKHGFKTAALVERQKLVLNR